MGRFLTNEFKTKDPRALLDTFKMAVLSETAIPEKQYITLTGDQDLLISEGQIFSLFTGGVFITDAEQIGAGNLDVGNNFTLGRDYYIYICDTGGLSDQVYRISLNSSFPDGFNALNSRKIGGFHFGVCRRVNAALVPVNGSNQPRGTNWQTNIYNGIVPRSIWTLTHRPRCAPEGMVYLGGGVWIDIYISCDDGKGGILSEHNKTPLTGTEGLNWYGFNERAMVSEKRLPTYAEWLQAAFGSPQGLDANNTMGWTATTNTGRQLTGFVANAVSSLGCRDCAGNVWEWLDEFIASDVGTFAYHDVMAGQEVGRLHMISATGLKAMIAGGNWGNGVNCGARTVSLSTVPWTVVTGIGLRAACDSL